MNELSTIVVDTPGQRMFDNRFRHSMHTKRACACATAFEDAALDVTG